MLPFQIGSFSVLPGARRWIDLPAARLPTGGPMDLTLQVIHGTREGPVLWLSGGLHGDELDGIEIIRRVVSELDPLKLAGTVIAIPSVNRYGALSGSRYLPDRRDLNRLFPGSEHGSMGGQLAHRFMTEVVGRSDFGLDFHCGSGDRDNLPQIRADLNDERTRRLARAFGAPVIISAKGPEGSLRRAAVKAGVPILLYEGGEALRFTSEAIKAGVAGALRVLSALEMITTDVGPGAESVETSTSHWVRARVSGICQLDVSLGQYLRKGDRVGVIRDLTGDEVVEVLARKSGLVIGRRLHPLVYRGEAIAHLATV